MPKGERAQNGEIAKCNGIQAACDGQSAKCDGIQAVCDGHKCNDGCNGHKIRLHWRMTAPMTRKSTRKSKCRLQLIKG